MAKEKKAKASNGIKHGVDDGFIPLTATDERPTKKAKLLDDSDEFDSDEGGVSLKVNEDYARRFEHNKKRAEQHRLEEKYGKSKALQNGDDESDEDSEEGVDEDDEGELATEALDAELDAVLTAIRSKDPRVRDPSYKFYRAIEEEQADGSEQRTAEESLTLRQYHTKNLLEGKFSVEDDEEPPPRTYIEEMEDVKQDLIRQTHVVEEDGKEEEDDDDFLITKSKPAASKTDRVKITEVDIENADKDPETFLSNFMAARAWVPESGSHWKPLESDDEDDEDRAEEYENAYNMYFENSTGANEKLITYARDAVASTTVRREDKSGRRKAREVARAKREAERKEREEDLARLRKLKIEDMEDKVKQIRKTAGLTGRDFKMEEWSGVLEADWSDDQWDEEMRKRFGDAYYDENDEGGHDGSEGERDEGKKRKKPKKPKFDDDIDIKDLIPDFEDEDNEKPPFSLSSDNEDDAELDDDDDDDEQPHLAKSSKQRKHERAEAKSAARRDRRLIEKLVDSNLEYENALAAKAKAPAQFRYRETSPTTFGLTARDILLANDSQLNEFAGLKKLATFRDPAKKKKDKKSLSKKARLRQWRMETFGDEEGPRGGFEVLIGDELGMTQGRSTKPEDNGGMNIREGDGKKKKRRSRKRKAAAIEA